MLRHPTSGHIHDRRHRKHDESGGVHATAHAPREERHREGGDDGVDIPRRVRHDVLSHRSDDALPAPVPERRDDRLDRGALLRGLHTRHPQHVPVHQYLADGDRRH